MRLRNFGLLLGFYFLVLLGLLFTSDLTIFDTQTFVQSGLSTLDFLMLSAWLSLYSFFFLLINLLINADHTQRDIRLKTRTRVLAQILNRRLFLAVSMVVEIFLYCLFLVLRLTGSGKIVLIFVIGLGLIFNLFWLILQIFLVELLDLFGVNQLAAGFLVWTLTMVMVSSRQLQLTHFFLFDNSFISDASTKGQFSFPPFTFLQWIFLLAALYLVLLYFSKRKAWL